MQYRRILREMIVIAGYANRNCSGSLPRMQQPALTRCFATKSPPPPSDPDHLDFFADPENRPLRDVYFSPEGEEVLTVEADADLNKMDWNEFERIFGLDSVTDEEVDNGWEELKKKYNFENKVQKRSEAKRKRFGLSAKKVAVPSVRDKLSENGPSLKFSVMNEEELTPPNNQEVEQVERTTASSMSHNSDVAELLQTCQGDWSPKRFNDSHAFRQPVNKKRPGFERRIMSMEREMEKIVLDVLCKRKSDWFTAGADVERVLLSPNMKNLTVYYTLDESESLRPKGWWGRTNSKFESVVRAALARGLEARYVPQVHFEKAKTNEDPSALGGTASELDQLFDQITAEREELSKTTDEKGSTQLLPTR